MVKNIYSIYTQDYELYESVAINGEDDEDCNEQINAYCDRKQDVFYELEEPEEINSCNK